jgi:hypothetical protein
VFTVQTLTLFNLIASCCLSIFWRVIKRLLDAQKPIILKFYLQEVPKISGKEKNQNSKPNQRYLPATGNRRASRRKSQLSVEGVVTKAETTSQLSSDLTQCFFNEGKKKFTIDTLLSRNQC